jgi:hypothetical protein
VNAPSRSQWSSTLDLGSTWFLRRIVEHATALEASVGRIMMAVELGDEKARDEAIAQAGRETRLLEQTQARLATCDRKFGRGGR